MRRKDHLKGTHFVLRLPLACASEIPARLTNASYRGLGLDLPQLRFGSLDAGLVEAAAAAAATAAVGLWIHDAMLMLQTTVLQLRLHVHPTAAGFDLQRRQCWEAAGGRRSVPRARARETVGRAVVRSHATHE